MKKKPLYWYVQLSLVLCKCGCVCITLGAAAHALEYGTVAAVLWGVAMLFALAAVTVRARKCRCPNCGRWFGAKGEKTGFCPHCGETIDWDKTE